MVKPLKLTTIPPYGAAVACMIGPTSVGKSDLFGSKRVKW